MEVKFFNRWGNEGIKLTDEGIAPYVKTTPTIMPKTGGRSATQRFHKSKMSIVERVMNRIMVSGHKGKKHFQSSGNKTGKTQTVLQIMEDTLALIETKTKENPIAVLAYAIQNAAPREEVIAIEYGGARYPKAVECAPQRRVDIAIRVMTQGASQKAFNSKRTIVETLSDEIINAYNLSPNSVAISKKNETERQADSSR